MDLSSIRHTAVKSSLVIATIFLLHLIGVYIYEGGSQRGVEWGSTNIGLIGEAPSIPNPLEYGQNRQLDFMMKFLFRGLIRYDVDKTSYTGDIASCDISDLSKVTCTLRQDQLWSDGTQIQVGDIVATYQAFRTSSPNEKIKNFLAGVSVVSTGTGMIEFSAREKNSLMLDILSYPIVRSDMLERIRTGRLAAEGYLTSGSYVFTEKSKNEQYGYERITIKRNPKNPWESWLDKYHFFFFPDANSLERGTENLNIIVPSVKKERLQLSPRFAPYEYTMQEYIGLFANTDTLDTQVRTHLMLQLQDSLSGVVVDGEKPVHNILGYSGSSPEKKLTKSLSDILKEKWYTKIDAKIASLDKETGILTGSSVNYGENTWIDAPTKKKIWFTEVADGILTIAGKAPTDAKTVSINDYNLKEYIPGNWRFSYKVSVADNTLQEGKNTYTLRFDTGSGLSIWDTLTIYYSKDAGVLKTLQDGVDKTYLDVLNTPEQVGARMAKITEQKNILGALDQRYYYNAKLVPYTLHITYISEPASIEKYATTISDALTSIGIKSELVVKDSKGLATMLQKWEKNYDFIVVGFEASGRLSRIGQVFLSSEAKTGINFSKIESKSLDALFASLRTANTTESVSEIIKNIQNYFDSEAFFLPISSPIHTLYIDKNLKGIADIRTFQDITTLYSLVKRASIKTDYILSFENKGVVNFFRWIGKKALWK